MTEHSAQKLQLSQRKTSVQVTGMGQQDTGSCTTEVKTRLAPTIKSEFRLKIKALIMKKLTDWT